jgi:hypothetical protein
MLILLTLSMHLNGSSFLLKISKRSFLLLNNQYLAINPSNIKYTHLKVYQAYISVEKLFEMKKIINPKCLYETEQI